MIRRLAWPVVGVAGAVVLACSCSLDAAVAVDDTGRLLRVDSLRLQSAALDLVLALVVERRDLVLELRWEPRPPDTRSIP
jgi:hypothetical protein